MVLDGLPWLLDPNVLEDWYYVQINNCKLISEDIAHYNRSKRRKEADGSYQYLHDPVNADLEQTP